MRVSGFEGMSQQAWHRCTSTCVRGGILWQQLAKHALHTPCCVQATLCGVESVSPAFSTILHSLRRFCCPYRVVCWRLVAHRLATV